MLRKTPSIEAIEIFVAAAQGKSFRSVARELALSPSAISRRIASLEAFLGMPLFDRCGQSQKLTPAGQRYLFLVEPAIDAIRRASTLLAEGDQKRLRIATSHSFAACWLMPRLTQLVHDIGMEVEILPTRDFDALRSGEANLGIWGGLPVPQDMIAETIAETRVFPVAAPWLSQRADERAELANWNLLSVREPAGLWERWFAAAGLAPCRPLAIREYATLQLMYEAAASGAGIALAMPLVTEPWLRTGRLLPFGSGSSGPMALGEVYRLYRPSRRMARTETEARFANWLHRSVAASMDEFREFSDRRLPA